MICENKNCDNIVDRKFPTSFMGKEHNLCSTCHRKLKGNLKGKLKTKYGV